MVDAGEIDLREGYERLFKVLGDANDKSRKTSRRERLRRQLNQLPPDEREQLIDDYENAAFRNLKDIRWGLSWPSDSEGEEEDDEPEDDEPEDDEPEDDEPEDDEPEDDEPEDDEPEDDEMDEDDQHELALEDYNRIYYDQLPDANIGVKVK